MDPNSQHDTLDRLKVSQHGTRRGSVNVKKSTSQSLLGGKRNKVRGRSQSVAVGAGSTILPKNIKR